MNSGLSTFRQLSSAQAAAVADTLGFDPSVARRDPTALICGRALSTVAVAEGCPNGVQELRLSLLRGACPTAGPAAISALDLAYGRDYDVEWVECINPEGADYIALKLCFLLCLPPTLWCDDDSDGWAYHDEIMRHLCGPPEGLDRLVVGWWRSHQTRGNSRAMEAILTAFRETGGFSAALVDAARRARETHRCCGGAYY